MDQERFDRITRTLASNQSRRGLLKGLTGTAIGGLLVSVGLAEASAKGGKRNSANAKVCQKGGWATHARDSARSTAFSSQDECVSYGAQGGTIVPLQEVAFTGVLGQCLCSGDIVSEEVCDDRNQPASTVCIRFCVAETGGPPVGFEPTSGWEPNCIA